MSLEEHAKALQASLEKANLVPGSASELIPSSFTPSTALKISFGDKSVDLGNFFRAGECKVAPTISFGPPEEEAGDASNAPSYLLILADPDAPTPDDPKFAFWRHWIVGGLQPLAGGDGAAQVALTKPTITEYLGPGPKDDSKPHRYLFLLYREPAGLDLKKADAGGEEFVERRSFKPAQFAEKFQLKLVAVNWMTCYKYALQKAHSSEPNGDWASGGPLSLACIFICTGKAVLDLSIFLSTCPPNFRQFTWESTVDNMDGLSAAASAIAIVQAASAVGVVAKAFYDTFISKDHVDRGGEATKRAASVADFMSKIDILRGLTAPASSQPGSRPAVGNAPSLIGNIVIASGLDSTLRQCEKQLGELKKKAEKMTLPPNSTNKIKIWWKTVLIKLKESDFAPLEITITTLLQQLTLVSVLINIKLSEANDARSKRIEEQIGQMLQQLGRQDARTHVANQQTVLPIDIQSAIEKIGLKVDQYTASLVNIQSALNQNGMLAKQQEQAWQDSYDILRRLEKLSLEPHLDRTSSSLSGTTEGSIAESMEVDEVIVPLAPALIHHPGFQFRDDRLDKATISKSVLDLIEQWMDPNRSDVARVYIRTSPTDDHIHDLCNRVVYELANSMLLCYNGLPREGPPPADGWYTMAHLVWWLSAQMRMPMPHIDGHMPASGYSPDVAWLVEKLEKTQDSDPVYVILYLPTESCHGDSDRRLYYSLIEGLCKISSSRVRILLFSDGTDDEIIGPFGSNTIVFDNLTQQQNRVLLADWSPENTG